MTSVTYFHCLSPSKLFESKVYDRSSKIVDGEWMSERINKQTWSWMKLRHFVHTVQFLECCSLLYLLCWCLFICPFFYQLPGAPRHMLAILSIYKATFQPKCAPSPFGRWVALWHTVIQMHLQNNYSSFIRKACYLNKCFPNKACSWVEFENYNN